MTSKVIHRPSFQTYFRPIWEHFWTLFSSTLMSGEAREDSRRRRDFINEILNRNPEAFKGEEDVQSMMQMYPGQF